MATTVKASASMSGQSSTTPSGAVLTTAIVECWVASAALKGSLSVFSNSNSASLSGQAIVTGQTDKQGEASLSGQALTSARAGVNGIVNTSGQAITTANLFRVIEISAGMTISSGGTGTAEIPGPVITQVIPYEPFELTNAGRDFGASATVRFFAPSQGGLACPPMGNSYVAPVLLTSETAPAERQLFLRFLEEPRESKNGSSEVRCHIWFHGTSSRGLGASGQAASFFRKGQAFKLFLGREGRAIAAGVVTGGPPGRGRDLPFTQFS